MAPEHPLRECDCDALNRVMERSRKALALAQACKDCDWDVDAYIAQLNEQLAMAQKAKATFFPHHP